MLSSFKDNQRIWKIIAWLTASFLVGVNIYLGYINRYIYKGTGELAENGTRELEFIKSLRKK